MAMRVLAPRRPQPVPVTGTLLSLTAHAALFAAVVVGPNGSAVAAATPGARAGGTAGERLHWIGVNAGSGTDVSRPRPGVRPPLAYVVPGHGGMRAQAADEARTRAAGHGVNRDVNGRGEPVPPAAAQTSLRRVVTPRRPRLALRPALPRDLVLPDPQATLLVAGVLSAAPDLTRRVARPEDFVPTPASEWLGDITAHTSALAPSLLRPDIHLHDLPIPLIDNPPPAYPTALARAHVGGQVVVEFRIDSTGAVDLGSLRVVESTNRLFTEAVRIVLPQLHFMPAQLGEHVVGVTVRQPFVFTVRSGF